jgi:hypothetical protein
MIKVLRIKYDNPLSWQFSLTDSEVQKVLSAGLVGTCRQTNPTKRKFLRKGQGKATLVNSSLAQSTKSVARKDISYDNICGICQDHMTIEEFEREEICYCESQCGSNFHKKCLRMYANFNRSNKKLLLCPICRDPWIKIPKPPKTRKILKLKPKICDGKCNAIILDELYRCASCHESPEFNLCNACFDIGRFSSAHTYCCFVKSSVNIAPNWEPAVSRRELRAVSNELMSRELTDLDYDVLLSLDDGSQQSLVPHLMKAVQSVKAENVSGQSSKCVLCSRNKSALSMKFLPCDHVAHDSCLLEILTESLAHGKLGAAGAQCPKCKDGWIFPSLVKGSAGKRNGRNEATITRTMKAKKGKNPCKGERMNEKGALQISQMSQMSQTLSILSLNGRAFQSSISTGTRSSQLSQKNPHQRLSNKHRPILTSINRQANIRDAVLEGKKLLK